MLVNRVWMHHFGEGFVRTPDDLGVQSEPPSHPELLDYLASRFMEDGWSIKKLHQLIMLSSAYQQSSDTNPTYATKDPGQPPALAGQPPPARLRGRSATRC